MTKHSKPARITYLFGAGASIGTTSEIDFNLKVPFSNSQFQKLLSHMNCGIPITDQLNIYRSYFGRLLGYTANGFFDRVDKIHLVQLKRLFDKDLMPAFTSQLSPDTHARVLKAAGRHKDYEDFKLNLGLYMCLLEGLTHIDPRYSNLFANFIDTESGQIPENLNFLTYNFDASPERAWFNFKDPKQADKISFDDIKKQHGIISEPSDIDNIEANQSVFIKLHGAACVMYHNEEEKQLLDFHDFSKSNSEIHVRTPQSSLEFEERLVLGKKINAIGTIARSYAQNITSEKNYKSGIRFAWDINETDSLIGKAQEVLRNSEVLVVCGYTFPAFNLANDFKLLEAFLKNKSSRIILQLPENSIFEVKERLQEMIKSLNSNCRIDTFQNCSSFHIPIEYFRTPPKPDISDPIVMSFSN